MLNYLCDSCGKKGFPNPNVKQKMTKKFVETPQGNVEIEVPETRMVKRQDPFTGKMTEMPEAVVEYEQERIIRLSLDLGPNERICREFCTDCFEKVKDKTKELWSLLESFDPI